MENDLFRQTAVLEAARQMAETGSVVHALFASGSFATDTADQYSDVDLIAVAPAASVAALSDEWHRVLRFVGDIVFFSKRSTGSLLINAILDDWTRCDLVVMDRSVFARQTQDIVKPLWDPENLYEALSPAMSWSGPNDKELLAIINEFIRILGLLPVIDGRGEYFTGAAGVAMLRDLYRRLLIVDIPPQHQGGALHLNKLLSPAQTELIYQLPFPEPKREAVRGAHAAMANAFFPLAKAAAIRWSITWPTSFELATKRSLLKHIGAEAVAW